MLLLVPEPKGIQAWIEAAETGPTAATAFRSLYAILGTTQNPVTLAAQFSGLYLQDWSFQNR